MGVINWFPTQHVCETVLPCVYRHRSDLWGPGTIDSVQNSLRGYLRDNLRDKVRDIIQPAQARVQSGANWGLSKGSKTRMSSPNKILTRNKGYDHVILQLIS